MNFTGINLHKEVELHLDNSKLEAKVGVILVAVAKDTPHVLMDIFSSSKTNLPTLRIGQSDSTPPLSYL